MKNRVSTQANSKELDRDFPDIALALIKGAMLIGSLKFIGYLLIP
ncbi:MAG TPA: hypothetical protein PLL64_03595 [Rhodothermales bacterium]|nr:hypothetical protein [Rhodothermales bacterium]HRR07935.1 hypothetical protein [Rhodothermales bacterium]